MKTRIHIHREQIISEQETRHFLIQLPADAGKIVAVNAMAAPGTLSVVAGGGSVSGDLEMGRLRIMREGFVLIDMELLFEGAQAQISLIREPGVLEQDLRMSVSGRKTSPLYVKIDEGAKIFFCKYQNGAFVSDYMLSVYIIYKVK